MVFVIDDDEIMAECIANAIKKDAMIFTNGIDAMVKIAEGCIPEMIFLDILLDGPDGFAFLNELMSYGDTANIPIVLVTSLNIKMKDLAIYNIVGMTNKDTMKPKDIQRYVEQYT